MLSVASSESTKPINRSTAGVASGLTRIDSTTSASPSAVFPPEVWLQPTEELATGIAATSAMPTINWALDCGITKPNRPANSTGPSHTANEARR